MFTLKNLSIIIVITLLFVGCTFTKQFLNRDGKSGDYKTLSVNPAELVEMAIYCKMSYERANDENKLYEIRDNEFSYHVKQDSGVTISSSSSLLLSSILLISMLTLSLV